MSEAVRVLTQLTYLDLFKEQVKTALDVKGWVANQKYLVSPGMSSTSFTLTTHDSEGLRASLANDCNRMSMAAIESISGVQGESVFPNSSGWPTIRTYYASFFAAHALLRIFGYSYSQLENEHTRKVFEIARMLGAQGTTTKIESGLYKISIDRHFGELTFEKASESHKDMWRGLLQLIDQLDGKLSITSAISAHKIQAHDLLMELKKCITKSNSRPAGNWFSELRNQVNYQHLFGAWFPYENRQIDKELIQAVSKAWTRPASTFDAESKHKELDRFFESTALLLSFFRELLKVCMERAGDSNSVFQNGTLRLLNTVKAS